MKTSLLYLDPDARQLKAFRRLFSAEYDVRTTASVEDALWQLEDCSSNVIVCDHEIEGGGAQFLRLASSLCPEAFRVMISARARAGDVLTEVGTGVVHCFVPKPWGYEEMRRALERAEVFALTMRHAARPPDDERRRAPRRVVRIETRVLVLATGGAGGPAEGGAVHAMSAHTYDLSESGVALLVSANEVTAINSLGRECLLRFVLPLPSGGVELTARPVRQEWLGGEEFLIGAEIVDMPGRARALFMQFVGGLAG